jgi:hypothetical protein
MHAYGVSFDAGIYSMISLTAMMLSSIFSIGLAFFLKHQLAKMSIPNLSTSLQKASYKSI